MWWCIIWTENLQDFGIFNKTVMKVQLSDSSDTAGRQQIFSFYFLVRLLENWPFGANPCCKCWWFHCRRCSAIDDWDFDGNRKHMGFSEDKLLMVLSQQKWSGWVYPEADSHKYQKTIENCGNEGGDKDLITKYKYV